MPIGGKRNAVQASLSCEIVKKYPGQEQVDQSVVIKIPGHWFNGMDAADRAKMFEATAVEFSKCRTFGQGRAMAKTEGIRFQVIRYLTLASSNSRFYQDNV